MSTMYSYWAVDEHGIPYPLAGIEDWLAFHKLQHPERINIGLDEWKTGTGDRGCHVMVSTRFFGTDLSEPGHSQRCMYETATFLNWQLMAQQRVETRCEAVEAHQKTLENAHATYLPGEERTL